MPLYASTLSVAYAYISSIVGGRCLYYGNDKVVGKHTCHFDFFFFSGMKDAIDTSERVAHGETNQAQAVEPMTSLQQSFNPSK